MDLWHMITNDHANATHLCREIVGAMGSGLPSRERLFDQLHSELNRHIAAERETLYKALEQNEATRRLVGELRHEHAAIEAGLERLAGGDDLDGQEWTQRFEDFSYLLDQHFYRVEHELLPAARRVLTQSQTRQLQHAFARRKLAALRAGQDRGWRTAGIVLGALAGAAAVALATAAWRSNASGKTRRSPRGDRVAALHREQDGRPPVARDPRLEERRLHVM